VTEEAVREAMLALETRQGRMGAVNHVAEEQWESFLKRPPGLELDPQGQLSFPGEGDCFDALVPKDRALDGLRAGPWTFALAEEQRTVKVRARLDQRAKTLAASVLPGDVLRVCRKDGDEVTLDPRPWSEGAAVVIENATGKVVALAGGYDVAIEGFVRATQARRQPGSSFKLFVYAAALLAGKTQLDKIVDAPLALPAGGGRVWAPQNYDGRFSGPVTLRRALTNSLNTVSVRLTLQEGVDDVIRAARLFGVKSPLRKDPTIALGSSEVTLMEQAVAYATVARLGVRPDPIFIERVIDVRNREVGRAGADLVIGGERYGHLPGGSGERAVPAGVAYELADMLREVVEKGTARAAYKPGFDRAGKTGTTNGFVDAWFAGFTPRYTVAVWIGTDGTHSLGDKETGGRAALPAWIEIIEALPHVEGERLAIPDDAVLVRADDDWVAFARGNVPASVLPTGAQLDARLPLPEFGDPPVRLPVLAASTATAAADQTGLIIPSSAKR
jgi:penicillin-binding protein 1A